MPYWVLPCTDCNKDFVHSEAVEQTSSATIDPFVGQYIKPLFPNDVLELECPHCKKEAHFKRHQLRYAPHALTNDEIDGCRFAHALASIVLMWISFLLPSGTSVTVLLQSHSLSQHHP